MRANGSGRRFAGRPMPPGRRSLPRRSAFAGKCCRPRRSPSPPPCAIPKIVIEPDVPIPMRDGVVLRADVYRPDAGGKFPVAIYRGPYDKRSSLDDLPAVARNLAQRGYVCIAQDVRGRYASEGSYEPLAYEIADGVDTVEWAAAQPWSTGRVGMFGVSYAGIRAVLRSHRSSPASELHLPGHDRIRISQPKGRYPLADIPRRLAGLGGAGPRVPERQPDRYLASCRCTKSMTSRVTRIPRSTHSSTWILTFGCRARCRRRPCASTSAT